MKGGGEYIRDRRIGEKEKRKGERTLVLKEMNRR